MSESDPPADGEVEAEAETGADAGADDHPDPGSESPSGSQSEPGPTADADGETGRCAESGCERSAAVRVHVPWAADRDVCPAHGRALSAQDGVVAVPLDPEGASEEWP